MLTGTKVVYERGILTSFFSVRYRGEPFCFESSCLLCDCSRIAKGNGLLTKQVYVSHHHHREKDWSVCSVVMNRSLCIRTTGYR